MGPEIGEKWILCGDSGYTFIGVARDMVARQWLVFTDDDGGAMLIIEKDEFWLPEFQKQKDENESMP